MRIYKTKRGIIIEKNENLFLLENENWDTFINDDGLYDKADKLTSTSKPTTASSETMLNDILAPIQNQEVWASGVTYLRSKVGRQEESKSAGGADFYARVYEAERPELFFKATPNRVVGPGGKVRIRRDSTWDVPEPELTLVITSRGNIIGYTIGNDMSSRSIEGENPLYLPQAKTYDGSAALGPCIYVTKDPLPPNTMIQLVIERNNKKAFEGSIAIDQIKRTFKELAGFLFRETTFPYGCFLMTGTGIVPGNDFTLQPDDKVSITIGEIGTLVNTVERV
jgi:2-dehydro-3-deoxy-D-arabinonate dehydratase